MRPLWRRLRPHPPLSLPHSPLFDQMRRTFPSSQGERQPLVMAISSCLNTQGLTRARTLRTSGQGVGMLKMRCGSLSLTCEFRLSGGRGAPQRCWRRRPRHANARRRAAIRPRTRRRTKGSTQPWIVLVNDRTRSEQSFRGLVVSRSAGAVICATSGCALFCGAEGYTLKQ